MHKTGLFAYNIGDLCVVRFDYKDQIGVVISTDSLDPDSIGYNQYTIYLQDSQIMRAICEYAMEPVEENV